MNCFDRYEALQFFYTDYLTNKEMTRSNGYEKSDFDNRLHAVIPCLENYKYALGRLNGFLFAMQWKIDDKESSEERIIVRRCSDNRIVKIIKG